MRHVAGRSSRAVWLLVAVLSLSSCRQGRHTVPILGSGGSGEAVGPAVGVSADGGGLTFAVASCHGKPVASVVETATEVRVKVVASTAFHGKCADSVTVHLASPLNNRNVVDVTSGHQLIIGS